MPEFTLGECIIQPINQIGEHVKYQPKTGKFVLSKRGSVFNLSAYFEDPNVTFSDFRRQPLLTVTLRVGNVYVGFDFATGRALGIPINPGDPVPRNAVLVYVKQQFDSLSVSFGIECERSRRWLRHCNSILKFDYEGTGLSFSQDASFLVLAAPVTPIKYDYPIANGCDNKHSSSCDQWGDRIHIPSAIDNPETSLSLKIDRVMERLRASNERLVSKE